MRFRTICFLVWIPFILAPIAAAQTASPEERFAYKLTDFTAAKPVIVDDVPDDEDELTGVRSVTIQRFKSKKPVSTDPDTYATLALIVLEYPDTESAAEALRKVPGAAGEEMRKSPELNFVNGAKLYRLIGACLLTGETWKEIETHLTDAVFGDGKKPEAFVSIACGGNVTVSSKQ